MKPGEKIDVLFLNNSSFEISSMDKENNVEYDVEYFFKDSRATFTKGNGLLDGKIEYKEVKLTNKYFEFQIEYKKDHWCRLENDLIPEDISCDCEEYKNLEMTNLETNNYRLGYMGPAIKWNELKNIPKIVM